MIQSLPALESIPMAIATDDSQVQSGDAAMAALAAMWMTIFQQQVLPAQIPEQAVTFDGAEAVEADAPKGRTGLGGLFAAVRVPVAGTEGLPKPILQPGEARAALPSEIRYELVSLTQETHAIESPAELAAVSDASVTPELPAVRDEEHQQPNAPVENAALTLPAVTAPALETKPVEGAPPLKANEPGPVALQQATTRRPVASPGTNTVIEKQKPTNESNPSRAGVAEAETTSTAQQEVVLPFESVVSLRKQVQSRTTPIHHEPERSQQPEVARTESDSLPAVLLVPRASSEQKAEDVHGVSIEVAEVETPTEAKKAEQRVDLPIEEPQQPKHSQKLTDLQIKAAQEPGPPVPAVTNPTVAQREPSMPLEAKATAPPATKPTQTREATSAPAPAWSSGESKTISIRIPLTDSSSRPGSPAAHIDLVFQQKNQDLTLSFHSPTAEIQRNLDESMPMLMDKLKTENWAARPQESQFAVPVDSGLDSRRRMDPTSSAMPVLDPNRPAATQSQSGSEGFNLDEQSQGRQGSPHQQGRNRRREQVFEIELDEKQQPN